jgi:hypothetical protein
VTPSVVEVDRSLRAVHRGAPGHTFVVGRNVGVHHPAEALVIGHHQVGGEGVAAPMTRAGVAVDPDAHGFTVAPPDLLV